MCPPVFRTNRILDIIYISSNLNCVYTKIVHVYANGNYHLFTHTLIYYLYLDLKDILATIQTIPERLRFDRFTINVHVKLLSYVLLFVSYSYLQGLAY
jgi:hypothetical protein